MTPQEVIDIFLTAPWLNDTLDNFGQLDIVTVSNPDNDKDCSSWSLLIVIEDPLVSEHYKSKLLILVLFKVKFFNVPCNPITLNKANLVLVQVKEVNLLHPVIIT